MVRTCVSGKEKCVKCNATGTWAYMPGTDHYCDKHVPRGCSCMGNKDEPCIEYWYDEKGWDIHEQ